MKDDEVIAKFDDSVYDVIVFNEILFCRYSDAYKNQEI